MVFIIMVLLLGQGSSLGPVTPRTASQPTAAPPALAFDTQALTFGEAWQFDTLHAAYVLRNAGPTAARVLGVDAAQPGAQVEIEPGPEVRPGASITIKVRQQIGARLGRAAFRYSVRTDQPSAALRKLTLAGFVQSAYDPERALLDFGTLDRTKGAERMLGLATREATRLHVVGIEGTPDWLHVEAQPDTSDPARAALRLRAQVRAGAPLGLQAGVLRVRTDLARQPTYELAWRAAVFGDVVPAQPGVDLGLLRLGVPHEVVLALRSRTQADVRVVRVEVDGHGVHAAAAPCSAEPGCVELRVRAEPRELGTLAGRLLVHLAGEAEPVPVPYAGLVVRTDTQVRDLPVPDDGEPSTSAGSADSLTPAATTTSAGPTRPDVSGSPAAAADQHVTLRWRAARETGVYGYLAYRAEQREGPYLRLGPTTIRVPDDGAAEHAYEYIDSDVLPGRTYFYYLDSVSTAGVKQTFSGVLTRAVAAGAPTPVVGPR